MSPTLDIKRSRGRRVALQLYNVRTRQKEPFVPADPENVGVYVCGLTVYDHAHLGHARTYISFEVIRRWLEHHFGDEHVTYIQNVTDVEDKILARAAELGVSPAEHSAKWDAIAHDALRRAGVRDADEQPHVTGNIPEIIEFIQTIIKNGYAYATDTGNVYFDVPAYDAAGFGEFGYGRLSGRNYKEMAAGTRKDVHDDKRHPADFALWKAVAEGDHPDGFWKSPWGDGRPGWHIECSLMSTQALGNTIDIHGGGQDLIFPHHENEIAQSQAATGEAPFVRTWMHTGFLNVDGQKMSKSLGNFIVLTELLDELKADGIDPEVLRFYFIQTHYRSKIDFSRKGLKEAEKAVERLHRTRRLLDDAAVLEDVDNGLSDAVAKLRETAFAALDDDIHTPGALAAMFEFVKASNKALDAGAGGKPAADARAAFEAIGRVLTLFESEVESEELPDFDDLLRQREQARTNKDWDHADKIRDTILAAGYVIQDTPQGPRVEKA